MRGKARIEKTNQQYQIAINDRAEKQEGKEGNASPSKVSTPLTPS